jgi:L-fuconolactonase
MTGSITRRAMVGGAMATGAALTAGAPSVLAQAPAKRLIVDSQIHLWKASSPDYPWPEGTKPQLPEPFTYERAVPLMDAAGVDRAVIVPASFNDINSYALEAAAKHPTRFKVMGRIPIENPKSAELLPKWKEQPHMLGVRVTFLNPKHVELLTSGGVDWLWSGAEKAGLPIMFLAFGRSGLFGPIAEKYPNLRLIVDHMGVNAAIAKEGRMAEQIGIVAGLAKHPNVSVKLSNLPNASMEDYPFKDLNDPIKRLFDAYGPQRCHWGTDVTNGLVKTDWRKRLTHFTEEIKFMSEADKDLVLGRSLLQRLNWA